MIRANPILGVGLGAFQAAHPTYSQSNSMHSSGEAHNDYLQVLADCGIPGALTAIWFIAAVARAVMRGIRSRDPLFAGLALGCGGGIFAILVHSLFDFNLQIPTNALLFLFLAAVVSHIGTLVAKGGLSGRVPRFAAARTGVAS